MLLVLFYGGKCVGLWAAVPAALRVGLACVRDMLSCGLLSTVATAGIGAATVATIASSAMAGIASHAGVCGWRGSLWCCLTVMMGILHFFHGGRCIVVGKRGCAAVCTVASVLKPVLYLLPHRGVGSLCEAGISRVSAIVSHFERSPLSSSSLLLLFAVGPLFE